jgi:ferric-dicitrate binding protein FerR (iron transport regulator)
MVQFDDKKITDEAWNKLYNRLKEDHLIDEHPIHIHRHHSLMWAACIAIVCLATASIFLLRKEPAKEMRAFQNRTAHSTLVTTLEDSSIVFLASDSRLLVPDHFTSDKRDVRLEGDAAFDIARNAQRPFYIETEEVTVKVLGTAFQINTSTKSPFTITVSRGLVELTHKKSGQTIKVKAGETVSLQSDRLNYTSNSNFTNLVEGEIQFKDETLSNILHVLNRVNEGTSIRAGKEVSDRRLTVSFENESPEEMAMVLSLAINASYHHVSDGWIITNNE